VILPGTCEGLLPRETFVRLILGPHLGESKAKSLPENGIEDLELTV